jgi:hypothetical protein
VPEERHFHGEAHELKRWFKIKDWPEGVFIKGVYAETLSLGRFLTIGANYM